MAILNSFADLFSANTNDEWWTAVLRRAELLGLEKVLLWIVPRSGLAPQTAYMHTNFDTQWCAAYESLGMIHIDPTVAHCAMKAIPLIWSSTILVF